MIKHSYMFFVLVGMKLYFTYDEEIGFNGIYDIIKSKEEFPKVMIFGEPTNNEILVGSK